MDDAVLTPNYRLEQTRRVTIVGALVNLLLAGLKILFGWLGQSQSLLADGIHSLSDLFSDAIVWLAARHADVLHVERDAATFASRVDDHGTYRNLIFFKGDLRFLKRFFHKELMCKRTFHIKNL